MSHHSTMNVKNWDTRTCLQIDNTNHAQVKTFSFLPFFSSQSSKFDDKIWREIKSFSTFASYFLFLSNLCCFWMKMETDMLKNIAQVNITFIGCRYITLSSSSSFFFFSLFSFLPLTSFKLTQQDGFDLLNGWKCVSVYVYVNE